jgi:hypothetical protein
MVAASTRCDCSEMHYRNNHDGTQDQRIKGKNGCPKCHSTGMLQQCSTCDGCGMLPGSKVCGGCGGHGATPGPATAWTRKKTNSPA